jgi:outer membrane protein
MKNGLLIWNVLLTLICGYLLISHLGGKGGAKVTGKRGTGDTVALMKSVRIAYFELDSIEANYKYVQDVKKEISQKEAVFESEAKRMDQQYKNKYEELAGKTYTSQAEQDAAQNTLAQLGEKLRNEKQQLEMDLQKFAVDKNLNVKKEIEKFIKGYNTPQRYTYILSYEPGFLYYLDTSLNITGEVIKGLNQAYKPEAKK